MPPEIKYIWRLEYGNLIPNSKTYILYIKFKIINFLRLFQKPEVVRL